MTLFNPSGGDTDFAEVWPGGHELSVLDTLSDVVGV